MNDQHATNGENAPTTASGADGEARSRRKNKGRRSNFDKHKKAMLRACESMLEEEVVDVAYPGGKSRDAVALTLKSGMQVIAAVRNNAYRANLEYRVLEGLSTRGAPVPKVLGYDGETLLLQELLAGRRLSQALATAAPDTVENLLDSALTGLARAQQAGSAAGLDEGLPALGAGKDWIADLLRRPLVIGGFLNERPRRPRVDALRDLFAIKRPRFVKWDARPGNAMAGDGQQVSWFDWEHSGTRCRLDDVAWLLCDEFTPNLEDVESRLVGRHIEQFADMLSRDEAERYLRAYGVFHSVVRLGLILSLKKDEEWWDFDYCVQRDKVGVTLDCALRVTLRAARWADFDELTRSLVPWFEAVGHRLEGL